MVLPFMTKQVIHLNVDEFSMLLRDRSVFWHGSGYEKEEVMEDGEDGTKAGGAKAMFTNPATLEMLSNIRGGCCVALLAEEDLKALGLVERDADSGISGSLRSEQPFLLPCWKGKVNLGVMVRIETVLFSYLPLSRTLSHYQASKIDCDQMLDRIESAKGDTGV